MATGVNTIYVDEEDIIDVSEYPLHQKDGYVYVPRVDPYDRSLCQDNKHFTDFLNKCLCLEDSVEMEHIIQNVLVSAYSKADDEYKKSEQFTRVIKKAIQRLIDEPNKKYSHISDVRDTLKFHVKKVPKKRVNFVTLSTTSVIGKNNENNRKRIVVDNNKLKKSKKARLDVIAVDSEDDDVIPIENIAQNTVYNGDEHLFAAHNIAKKIFADFLAGDDQANNIEVDNEIIAIDEEANETKVDNSLASPKPKKNIHIKFKSKDFVNVKKSKHKISAMFEAAKSSKKPSADIKNTKLKESKQKYSANGTVEFGNNNNTPIEVIDSQEIITLEKTQVINDETNSVVNIDSPNPEIIEGIQHNNKKLAANENNGLLVPQMEIALEENKLNEISDTKKDEKIKAIEVEIIKYKKKIADLEVAEVTEDSSESAYIRCDRLQAHIVKLYKKLCSLNDAEPVKKREVRLRHLAVGLPEGPVRRLEKFLNKQADEDGVAPFPDFADVVRCVTKGNATDGLGWSTARIRREAHALFEACGRALQKRRQRREWNDLRAQLPPGALDDDPAARDPELAARLQLNRQLALRKEAEVLEKFCRMDAASQKVTVPRNGDKTNHTGESVSSSNEIPEKIQPETSTINEIGPVSEMLEEPQFNERTNDETTISIKNEPCDKTNDGLLILIKQEPYTVPVESCFKLDVSIAIEISDSDDSDEDPM